MTIGFENTVVIGRLVEDPVIESSPASPERLRAKFKLMNGTHKADDEGSETVELVQSCDIVAFGDQARLVSKYLKKGSMCCIDGRVGGEFHMINGEKKFKREIEAERIVFLRQPDMQEENHGK